MTSKHRFPAKVIWTGNLGTGTSGYKAYKRTWDMAVGGKQIVHCSNDPMLGGDPSKYNPEDLLISALSSCHMLWYLHLCSNARITVLDYIDNAEGIGEGDASGKGRFIEAVLRPEITIGGGNMDKAHAIHREIHNYCFIARSVSFPVRVEAVIRRANP